MHALEARDSYSTPSNCGVQTPKSAHEKLGRGGARAVVSSSVLCGWPGTMHERRLHARRMTIARDLFRVIVPSGEIPPTRSRPLHGSAALPRKLEGILFDGSLAPLNKGSTVITPVRGKAKSSYGTFLWAGRVSCIFCTDSVETGCWRFLYYGKRYGGVEFFIWKIMLIG